MESLSDVCEWLQACKLSERTEKMISSLEIDMAFLSRLL